MRMVDFHFQTTAEYSLFHIFHSGKYVYCFLLCFYLFVPFSVSVATAADYPCAALLSDGNLPGNQQNTASSPKPDIWCLGVGEGFRAGTRVFGASAGTTYGILMFGGIERHQLSMISVSYGEMTGDMKGTAKWYRGNIELRAELFGGAQFNSERLSLAGVAPHIRYLFATGTRLIPFIDAGAGVLLTEIRAPDLGGAFEFNEQAIIGADYFLKDNVSINITIQ
ncbi:MAG: acyloxyacyl hydrolase, partial [Smithella sp.]